MREPGEPVQRVGHHDGQRYRYGGGLDLYKVDAERAGRHRLDGG